MPLSPHKKMAVRGKMGSHQTRKLLAPGSWVFQPAGYENEVLLLVSHKVYGISNISRDLGFLIRKVGIIILCPF